MKRLVLFVVCLTSLSLSIHAGELYRWVDKDGKMNYGDMPPTEATDVERIKLSSEPTRNEYLPYETRRAQKDFPVTLYVSKVCGELCDQARGYLNKRGIPYSEKALETKQEIEAFKQLSGIGGAVPVLAVGKNFLRGFLESQWNSELDFAGYPKIPPYRAPAASPVPSATPAVR
jgi:hypothetical protein